MYLIILRGSLIDSRSPFSRWSWNCLRRVSSMLSVGLCSTSCFSMWQGRECSSFPLSLSVGEIFFFKSFTWPCRASSAFSAVQFDRRGFLPIFPRRSPFLQFSFLISWLVHVEPSQFSSDHTFLQWKCLFVLGAFPAVRFGSWGESPLRGTGILLFPCSFSFLLFDCGG